MGLDQRKDLYLIFKEAINNAAKYSHCKKVTIIITLDNHEITLQITDDGGGFNASNGTAGNGLRNMKQRASDMEGHVAITSGKGEGTTVFLKLKPHE